MKIAVLTWFRDMNYGTILQALALQSYIKAKGHQPSIINNLPERKFTIQNKRTFLQRVNGKLDYICDNKYKNAHPEFFDKKAKGFFDTIDDNCNVTRPINTDEDFSEIGKEFDMYICGSDQIWNPYWIEPHYFLDFVEEGRLKVAYAPSLGVSELPEKFHKQYTDWMSDFDGLSIREAEMTKQLREITKMQITNACDPVFLLSKEQWTKLSGDKPIIDGEYIFYYFLSYNSRHWLAVKKFAKAKKLKIVGVPVFGREYYIFDGERKIDASPLEFVNYINFAKYVFTDSFHGTSFSVLLEKQFYTFTRFPKAMSSTNSRFVNLLNLMKLDNRILKHNATKVNEQPDIDYSINKKPLNDFVSESKAYLDKFLD